MDKGKTIVYTAGVWDLFHIGHLNILKKSKEFGDILIVGINTDEMVEGYKKERPIMPFEERMAIVKECKCVDKVVKQTVPDDPKMMKELKVDILTVGDDWKDKYVEGIEYMKKHGKVVFLPYTKGISTTLLKERIICRNNRSKKNKFLIGKKTYLRPIEQVDLEGNWYTWFNDPDVTKHMKHGVFPNTYEKQKAFLERILDSTEMIQLAIIDRKTDKFIGVVSIREIDWVTRSGGIGIAIGEKDYWNKGYGLEAMALLLYHGFTKMNLNRIWTGQHAGLKKCSEAWQRHLCFKVEGIQRQAIFTDGKYHDYTLMAVLAKDFLKKLEEKTLNGILDEF